MANYAGEVPGKKTHLSQNSQKIVGFHPIIYYFYTDETELGVFKMF